MNYCSPTKEFSKLFLYLLLLTGVFLLAEISFFIQCTQAYFYDFNLIAHRIPIPSTILPAVLFFIFSHLLIHVAYTGLICIIAVLCAAVTKASPFKWGTILWLFGIVTILASNQYYFPNSKFAELSRIVLSQAASAWLLYFLWLVWLIILALAGYAILRTKPLRKIFYFLLLSAPLGGYFFYQNYFVISQDASTVTRPNIILIGIDSLRPDFLKKTPLNFMSSFLSQATVFSNTFTPIARTFPSWVGILSGLYPKESGVRFNLSSAHIDRTQLLPFLLKEQGYQTIYATDEARFSNIDQNFGFEKTITPPIGLNDFLLGNFNDFPLSNLLVNTIIGKWLFPYSYANRPAFITYHPNTFLALLESHIKAPRQRPLFLAVHFCLTHFPYLWSSHSGLLDKNPLNRYQAAIEQVDQQVKMFFTLLEKYQLLQHAIVVLLSDHGEALELAGDRITASAGYIPVKKMKNAHIPHFYPPSIDKEAVNQSAGHGTDVLGFSQYHSLLAFRLYGLSKQVPQSLSDYTLLLDIKPTLLDFLGIVNKSSGISLQKIIIGTANHLPGPRNLFLESDFSPEAIRSVHPQMRQIVLEGIELFTIDPHTTRILVRESMGQLIVSSKQYASIDHDWVLALYPQEHNTMIPVLVHLPSGEWTTDLRTDFAQKSPQKKMLQALKKFYGKEIKQLIMAD